MCIFVTHCISNLSMLQNGLASPKEKVNLHLEWPYFSSILYILYKEQCMEPSMQVNIVVCVTWFSLINILDQIHSGRSLDVENPLENERRYDYPSNFLASVLLSPRSSTTLLYPWWALRLFGMLRWEFFKFEGKTCGNYSPSTFFALSWKKLGIVLTFRPPESL